MTELARSVTSMTGKLLTLLKALNKRRRARKLAYAAKENLICSMQKLNQRDIDERLEKERRESSGRDRGRQGGKRYFSNSGKPGHNAKFVDSMKN